MNLLLSVALAAGLAQAETVVGPGEGARPNIPVISPSAFSPLSTGLELPALPDLKIDAVSNFEIPQTKAPETAFQGLEKFHQDVQMSAGPGEFWDGAHDEEAAHEEELVYVNREQKKQEAVKYAHAERPALDYRRHRFNKEDSEEFLAQTREFPGGAQATGHEMLGLLMTQDAVDTDRDFDPRRVEMSRFGKSDADLRPVLTEKNIPVYAYHDFLGKAFNYGLVYRVSDSQTQKTYHGIPHPVRQALGYHAEAMLEKPKAKAEPEQASRFKSAIAELARDAESLPAKDELFEFTAQTAEAAVKGGLLKRDQLSPSFAHRAKQIDFEVPSLTEALLTLLDSAHGTPWFDKALGLCRHAVAAGALEQGKLDEALAAL